MAEIPEIKITVSVESDGETRDLLQQIIREELNDKLDYLLQHLRVLAASMVHEELTRRNEA